MPSLVGSMRAEANGGWCPSRSSKPLRLLTGPGGFDSCRLRRRNVMGRRPPDLGLTLFPISAKRETQLDSEGERLSCGENHRDDRTDGSAALPPTTRARSSRDIAPR